jgi:glycosyltransferase involved in cell wall biosynthesis
VSERRDAERFRAAICAAPPALRRAPKVSVLVAAWNEADDIECHAESVLALRDSGLGLELEYVLVAGGSDGTYQRARRFEREGVSLLEQHAGEGKQRALRRAYARASGEIVYLTDADCLMSEAAVRRLLAPLVNDGAPAATGVSAPPRAQLDSIPLVAYQYAIQLYGDAHTPSWTAGLLGRNAAVTRAALERAGGFSADVPSGTDYHLAKALLASGSLIRHVPTSRVTTPYAATWPRYARQQRRWLRNVTLHGFRSGASDEALTSLRTTAVGAAMLAAPMGALVRPGSSGALIAAAWITALGLALRAKRRYLTFAHIADDVPSIPTSTLVRFTLLDFAVWATPLLDYARGARSVAW